MEIFKTTPNYNFLGKRKIFYLISIILIGLSVWKWVALGGDKYGVDFSGGHEFVVQLESGNSDDIRQALKKSGILDPIVQSFESGSNQYSVRIHKFPGEEVEKDQSAKIKEKFAESLKSGLDGRKFEILRSDYVGPTIGKELRTKALYATIFGILSIMIYVAFRFELAFGIGATVAIFHDIVVSTGVYLFYGHTISMASLAAALTIIGYSVNDTIVVFDRVRDEITNISKHKDNKPKLSQLVNNSINFTLSRTIITHLLTFFSVLALLLFGGGAISELSVFLAAGIISGTYSTVFIASPVMIAWHKFRGGTEEI
jgi:preprotein translocase SecF subunit